MQLKAVPSPKPMTEAQLQTIVLQLAQLHGYNLRYHTRDSRRSQPGFLDLVLVNVARGRVLFRELKTDAGKLTADQARPFGLVDSRRPGWTQKCGARPTSGPAGSSAN